MPAFFIAEVIWKDEAARRRYLAAVADTVRAYNGRLLVGPARSVEGEWNPKALAILEFETAARADEWYDSPEYAELKALRLRESDSKAVLVDAAPRD